MKSSQLNKLLKVASDAAPMEVSERVMASIAGAIASGNLSPDHLPEIDRSMSRHGWTVPGEIISTMEVLSFSLPNKDPDLMPDLGVAA